MRLTSSISFSITKKLVVNDTFENKTFYFEPGKVVDVPEEIVQNILDNPYNKLYLSIVTEAPKEIPELKVIQDPPLPETSEEGTLEEIIPEVAEEKKSEVPPEGKPLFTEEELLKMGKDDLVSIAKEMGINLANSTWKTETLIKKILDVKIPEIE